MSWHCLRGYGSSKSHRLLHSGDWSYGHSVLEAVTVTLCGVAVDLDDTRVRLLGAAAAPCSSSGRTRSSAPLNIIQQRFPQYRVILQVKAELVLGLANKDACHVTEGNRKQAYNSLMSHYAWER